MPFQASVLKGSPGNGSPINVGKSVVPIHQALLKIPGLLWYVDPEFPDAIPSKFIEQNTAAKCFTSAAGTTPAITVGNNGHNFFDFRGISDSTLTIEGSYVPQTFWGIMAVVPFAGSLSGANPAYLIAAKDAGWKSWFYRVGGGTTFNLAAPLSSGGFTLSAAPPIGFDAGSLHIVGFVMGPAGMRIYMDSPTTPVATQGAVPAIAAASAPIMIGGWGVGNASWNGFIGKTMLGSGDPTADPLWAAAWAALTAHYANVLVVA